jgi:DNA-binding CsgD family transcriptional regulator
MKSALDEVTRFATYLTRKPSTDELLHLLIRDYLRELYVHDIEVQILVDDEVLTLRLSAGDPIHGRGEKSVDSLVELIADKQIFSTLEHQGVIHNPQNNVTVTAITIDASVKGFYLFQHSQSIQMDDTILHYLRAISSLLTIYLLGFLTPTKSTVRESKIKTENISDLTARQLLILAGMVDGKTNHELSISLGFSVSTIRHETMAIFRKLDVSDRKEAAKQALTNGLV